VRTHPPRPDRARHQAPSLHTHLRIKTVPTTAVARNGKTRHYRKKAQTNPRNGKADEIIGNGTFQVASIFIDILMVVSLGLKIDHKRTCQSEIHSNVVSLDTSFSPDLRFRPSRDFPISVYSRRIPPSPQQDLASNCGSLGRRQYAWKGEQVWVKRRLEWVPECGNVANDCPAT
jgi:hypothetical protein